MPIYVYQCNGCEHTFERLLLTKEERDESPVCPQCQSQDVSQKITSGSFALKGPGWAKDSYRK